MNAKQKVREAFYNFDKWDSYGLVFHLMDKRQITLKEIAEIASDHGIPKGVIYMRRHQFLMMQRMTDNK